VSRHEGERAVRQLLRECSKERAQLRKENKDIRAENELLRVIAGFSRHTEDCSLSEMHSTCTCGFDHAWAAMSDAIDDKADGS
jgi:hypothetical protein